LVVGALIATATTRPSPTGRRIPAVLLAAALVLGLASVALFLGGGDGVTGGLTGPARTSATLVVGEPTTLDPGVQGDLSSAVVISQLFEGLTGFDPGLTVRPALASSWDVTNGGTRIVFHLRPGLRFSDGSPIHGADVVRSWMRLVDPRHPSPLLSLLSDVEGALDYAGGRTGDAGSVGFHAAGDDVEVRLNQPSPDFPSVVAGSSFGVVPPGVGTDPTALLPDAFVSSGAYLLSAISPDGLTLKANEHYWAGAPAIPTIQLLVTLHGKSPVTEFEAGTLDYVPIGDADAAWIEYDRTLGPNLRVVPSLGTTYYGFDTTRPPFNDVRVRRAFAQAVDWKRLVSLAGPASQIPANSMIPAGIPGHPSRDFSPAFDPAAAKAALAEAGYPSGTGFPHITLVSSGSGIDEGIVTQLKANLGIDIGYEVMEATQYFGRLSSDVPAFWVLSWAADYPGANDFLGVLLGTGQANNYGGWASPEFDQALADAGLATDPAGLQGAYDRAQEIVARDVPVVPVSYGTGWALARTGLLGAGQNGLGVPRLAGLAWDATP
jgi:ABC-type oligopeptide transport system substrate-binding subunit